MLIIPIALNIKLKLNKAATTSFNCYNCDWLTTLPDIQNLDSTLGYNHLSEILHTKLTQQTTGRSTLSNYDLLTLKWKLQCDSPQPGALFLAQLILNSPSPASLPQEHVPISSNFQSVRTSNQFPVSFIMSFLDCGQFSHSWLKSNDI